MKKFNNLQGSFSISSIFFFVLLVCAESSKSSSRTGSANVLMNAGFGFFVALVISVKQKDSSAVESKVYPLLGSALDQ